MKPYLGKTGFGFVVADDQKIEHDIIIRLSGEIEKRKKKLSKAVFGTSHILSFEEAEYIFEEGADRLIIGSGQDGMVTLSDEAKDYFLRKKCRVDLFPTPQAAEIWNSAGTGTIALFHVTC